jgi:methylaspartate ammonia-lyase
MEVGVMPKELIYSREALAGEPVGPVEHVAVGWTKEAALVQIGLVPGPSVKITIDGETPDLPGLLMDLDRNRINQLIRSLRKARDSAYGGDA